MPRSLAGPTDVVDTIRDKAEAGARDETKATLWKIVTLAAAAGIAVLLIVKK